MAYELTITELSLGYPRQCEKRTLTESERDALEVEELPEVVKFLAEYGEYAELLFQQDDTNYVWSTKDGGAILAITCL